MLSRISDFAAEHEVPVRRVRNAIRAGFIPVVKIRGGLRVDREKLPDDYCLYLRGEMFRRDQEAKRSVVYFIGAENGPIKIGTAVDVVSRIVTLQCGSPARLKLLASVPGSTRQERAYHAHFAEHRLHGEWFERHPDILAEIDRLNSLPAGVGRVG